MRENRISSLSLGSLNLFLAIKTHCIQLGLGQKKIAQSKGSERGGSCARERRPNPMIPGSLNLRPENLTNLHTCDGINILPRSIPGNIKPWAVGVREAILSNPLVMAAGAPGKGFCTIQTGRIGVLYIADSNAIPHCTICT